MKTNIKTASLAISEHRTQFFDAELRPIVPQIGQWFCEFENLDDDTDDLSAEALVEYRGASQSGHRVLPEYADCDREQRGLILVLQ